ncbi:MAG: hypothetical protein FWB94_00400 [Chitinispirillia bacterium]|nr:hypothetical protein [Chitinispirillia bacterium]
MEVVTFFSYKGGAGRSSTALNTLPHLFDVLEASKNAPILLMDMDLDSAGMTYLLEKDEYFKDKDVWDVKQFLKSEDSLLELDSPATNLEDHEFYKKLVPVGEMLGVENEAVLFLGVDDREPVDIEQYSCHQGDKWRDLRTFCNNNNFKAIVLDSAAGTQYVAKLAVTAATLLVSCLRATTQFRIGTFNYLRKLMADHPRKKVILLPTVIPEDRMINDKSQYQTTVEDITRKISIFKLQNVNVDFVDVECLGINEVERFKWLEGVLYKMEQERKLLPDEQIAAQRYRKLAETIKRA